MSKLLANQISNYNDNGPVEVKDGVNIPTGKPLQVAGVNGTSGQYLTSTGSSIAWSTFPSIPAAQVQTNWNATSGLASILNKPTLATVATSGSYNDLINKPTIPGAQIQSDWSQSNSASIDFIKNKPTIPAAQVQSNWNENDSNLVSFIQNKPTLFSGSWNDLTDRPTLNYLTSESDTLASVTGRGASTSTDVTFSGNSSFAGGNVTMNTSGSPSLNASGTSRFEVASMENALLDGSIDHTGDTTTKIQFETSVIKLDTAGTTRINVNNSGATITGALTAGGLTYPTSNGTSGYVLTSDGAGNVTWQAGGSGNTQVSISDTIPAGTASAGDLWWKSDEGRLKVYYQDADSSQWVDASPPLTASSGATVTTSDSAPSSPNDGDLWWKSDEGRLKVYYQDADSIQWVDASPIQTPTNITQTTTNGTNALTVTTSTTGFNANAIEIRTDNNTASAVRWRFTPPGHFIPFANAAYDIGNAEYKVRHLFLSDNTVYFQGNFLKVAQHDAGGGAQAPSYLIPLSKLKDALNASADYEAFKAAILAITDA